MTIAKSLLYGISALTLASGAAFAAGGESFSEPMNQSMPESSLETTDAYFAQSDEYDVYYIYPVEVTESYIIVPSVDSEAPQG